MVRVNSLLCTSLLLLCATLVLPSCEKSSGSGKPAAAPRSGQPSASKAAAQPEQKETDEAEGDEQLVPPPEDGYAPVE